MPSRRQYLAALGAGGALVAGATGVVTVPHLSPGWVRWRAPVAGVGRSIATAGGNVFVAARHGIVAVDAATGDRAWTVRIGGQSTIGVDVGSGAAFAGHRSLAAVEFDGEVRWRRPLSDVVPADEAYLLSCPTVDGDTVYASTGTGAVVSLSAADGRTRWVTNPPTGAGRLELAPDHVVVSDVEGPGSVLYGLDRSSGEVRWRRSFDARPTDLAVGRDGTAAYALSSRGGGGLVGIDAATGEETWREAVTATRVSVDRGTVYGVAGEPRPFGDEAGPGALFARDADDGELQWRRSAHRWGVTAPARRGDALYVGTVRRGLTDRSRGALAVYSTTGDHRATVDVGEGADPSSPPVVVDGAVYLATDERTVALRLR